MNLQKSQHAAAIERLSAALNASKQEASQLSARIESLKNIEAELEQQKSLNTKQQRELQEKTALNTSAIEESKLLRSQLHRTQEDLSATRVELQRLERTQLCINDGCKHQRNVVIIVCFFLILFIFYS
jgi:cell shape-determining protein MreC